MAVIYTKPTSFGNENALILSPREALSYPFPFSDWTKARACMAIGYTTVNDPNDNMDGKGDFILSPPVNERDRLMYGVKPMSGKFPSENNEAFVGLKTYNGRTYISFPQTIFDQRNIHGEDVYIGVHLPTKANEAKIMPGFGVISPPTQNNLTSNFCGYLTLYMEIINKGTANQQMLVRFGQSQGTDTSMQGLFSRANAANLTTMGTFVYNESGVPFPVPNSFFLYNPIAGLSLRVFGLIAIKEL